jgi:hypothetical protein
LNNFVVDRLLSQLELLQRLCAHGAEERWALQAIGDAAAEIERVAADDLACDYARDIRIAARGNQLAAGRRIGDTLVGERIERLADYCSLLQQAPAEDVARLRPWP